MDQAQHHNAVAGEIVHAIVAPILKGGGTIPDVLILTESVLTGVLLAISDRRMLIPASSGTSYALAHGYLDALDAAVRKRLGDLEHGK